MAQDENSQNQQLNTPRNTNSRPMSTTSNRPMSTTTSRPMSTTSNRPMSTTSTTRPTTTSRPMSTTSTTRPTTTSRPMSTTGTTRPTTTSTTRPIQSTQPYDNVQSNDRNTTNTQSVRPTQTNNVQSNINTQSLNQSAFNYVKESTTQSNQTAQQNQYVETNKRSGMGGKVATRESLGFENESVGNLDLSILQTNTTQTFNLATNSYDKDEEQKDIEQVEQTEVIKDTKKEKVKKEKVKKERKGIIPRLIFTSIVSLVLLTAIAFGSYAGYMLWLKNNNNRVKTTILVYAQNGVTCSIKEIVKEDRKNINNNHTFYLKNNSTRVFELQIKYDHNKNFRFKKSSIYQNQYTAEEIFKVEYQIKDGNFDEKFVLKDDGYYYLLPQSFDQINILVTITFDVGDYKEQFDGSTLKEVFKFQQTDNVIADWGYDIFNMTPIE